MRRIFLVLACAFLVAGCGGGGGRLSHAGFVKRADTLCRASVAKLKALNNPTNLSELAVYLQEARPIRAHFLDEARKLQPPKRDLALWRRALALDETVLRDYDEMQAALERHDRPTLIRISKRLRALPAKNPFEQQLGMQGC